MHVDPIGDCFIVAYEVAAGAPPEVRTHCRISHGIVTGTGEIEGIRHPHAWVEMTALDGQVTVIDQANGLDLMVPRDLYYEQGQIDQAAVRRYDVDTATGLLDRTGHYGPWGSLAPSA